MNAAKDRRLPRVPTPVWVLALAIGCALVAISPGAASSGTTIEVSSASAAAGQSLGINVTAKLNANDTMNGFDIGMSFDPTIVNVTAISSPGWTALPGTPGFDNTGGTLHVAGFQIGTGCGKSSSCGLFSVTFTAMAPGASSIHITGGTFGGTDSGTSGAIGGVTVFDGNATVTGGKPVATATTATAAPTTAVPATATFTSTPTQTIAASTPTPVPAAATTPAGTVTAPAVISTPQASTTPLAGAAVDTTTPAAATATAEPTNSDQPTPVPAAVVTVAPAPSPPVRNGAVGPVALAPLPPATGSAGSAPWDSGQSPVRLGGWLLVAVSLAFLAIRGAKGLAAGTPTPASPPTGRGHEGSIEDVVVRYLSDQESAALDEHRQDGGDESPGR